MRLPMPPRLISLISLLGVLAAVWVVDAQQPPASGRPPTSTGTSSPLDASVLRVVRLHRDPGSRSYWHSHPNGQIWYIEQGRGRIQERGGRVIEIRPGDEPVYTPPNVEHWHGSTPTEPCTYVAIACCGNNYVKWSTDEVTMQQFSEPAIRRKQATPSDLHVLR
jgi:quercetin dioxygenase-like cupin family protein